MVHLPVHWQEEGTPAPSKTEAANLPAGDPGQHLIPRYSHVNMAGFKKHLHPSRCLLANSWQLFAEHVDFKAAP